MKKIILLFLFLIGRIYLCAQVFDQSVINTLQNCIQQQQYDKADSIIKSFRDKDLPETSDFWLNLIHSDVGISKYRQSRDPQVYIPYMQSGIDAFTFLSHYINKENASTSLDLWPFLFYWSDLFSQLDNTIVDSLSTFSNKYYHEFERKDPTLYYLAQTKLYWYFFDKQDWDKCVNIMSQVENGLSDIGSTIEHTAYSRFDIGQAFMNKKDVNSAEKWYISSYNTFLNISNREDNKTYGNLLLILSKLYFEYNRNLEKAYKFSLEAERVNKKLFGEGSKAHIASLDFLSYSELGLGKNEAGVEHLEKEEMLLKNTLDLNEAEKQSYYDKLKLAYLRLNINKDVDSQDSIITENTMLYKATNAFAQGQCEEAVIHFLHLLEIYESNFPSVDISNYIYAVGSLSNVYVSIGNYIEADNILNRAIELLKSNNSQSKQLRYLYQSKGLLYYTINNIDMALSWYNMAKKMFNENEKDGLAYALLTSNLSTCYFQTGDLSMAKDLSDEAYTLCNRFYGEYGKDANDRLLLLNNIATIYTKLKDFSKGKELYGMVIKEANSKQHEGTKALALMNLAEIYFQEKNLSKAEEFLTKALDLEAASYVRDMAQFDYLLVHCMTHNGNTISEIKNYNDAVLDNVSDIFAHFSEAERENYWTQKSQTLVALNNLAALTFNTSQAKTTAYNNALFTKNMLLDSGNLLGKIVKNSLPEIQNAFSLMQSLKQALSNKATPKDSLNNYISRINMLEKQIVSSIPDFNNRIKGLFKNTDDIQNMLSGNDVAIEFIFLPQIKFPIEDSELQYGALILTKNSVAPILIPLCLENELEDILDDNSTSQEVVDNIYSLKDTRLYKMLWANIEPYIHKGSTVYYSPTGYISKINMSVISDGNKRLQDIYKFHEVSTTSMIEEVKQQEEVIFKSAILFGDINYNEDADMMETNSIKYDHFSSIPIMTIRSQNRSTWDLLPGTKEEIFAISKQLEEKGIIVRTYSHNDANEESMKALNAKAPDIIHIATHGFYYSLDDNITSRFFGGLSSNTKKDHSLLYSGLLFAGANNAWSGKSLKNSVEDGVMTAYEVSQLDLSNNKLTVLSACNTGLGEIDNVDGVFGLQRAFKKAGVGSLLVSLWKVPDEETKQLMSSFYKYLLSGNSSHQALSLAQKHLIEQGKTPFYWAGFILLD